MSIKDNSQYKYYLTWLNHRLEFGEINQGQYELMKITETLFLEYCFRYNNQPKFKQSQDQLYKTINRDILIQDIISDGFNSQK